MSMCLLILLGRLACIVEPDFVEVKTDIEKLGTYKSSFTEQIPAELIQAGDILRSTNLL
jgi:hypothetical protein